MNKQPVLLTTVVIGFDPIETSKDWRFKQCDDCLVTFHPTNKTVEFIGIFANGKWTIDCPDKFDPIRRNVILSWFESYSKSSDTSIENDPILQAKLNFLITQSQSVRHQNQFTQNPNSATRAQIEFAFDNNLIQNHKHVSFIQQTFAFVELEREIEKEESKRSFQLSYTTQYHDECHVKRVVCSEEFGLEMRDALDSYIQASSQLLDNHSNLDVLERIANFSLSYFKLHMKFEQIRLL